MTGMHQRTAARSADSHRMAKSHKFTLGMHHIRSPSNQLFHKAVSKERKTSSCTRIDLFQAYGWDKIYVFFFSGSAGI